MRARTLALAGLALLVAPGAAAVELAAPVFAVSYAAWVPAVVVVPLGVPVAWDCSAVTDCDHTVTTGDLMGGNPAGLSGVPNDFLNSDGNPDTFHRALDSDHRPVVHTFSAPGTYTYFCRPHSLTMKGVVIVV